MSSSEQLTTSEDVMYDEVALAAALVQIPSVNPAGHTRAVCDFIETVLDPRFVTWRVEPEPEVVSLVAEIDFGPGPRLVLNGHVDVVPTGDDEWCRDPFSGEIADGRLHGRGSLDMKGAVAAFTVAANRVARDPGEACGSIVLAIVADEESGGRLGAGAVVSDERFRGDAVLVAEPSDGGICLAHRGMCFVSVKTLGSAAHASVPEEGVNAVDAMLDVLLALRSLELTYEPHSMLRPPTFAIGTTITGGTRPNVIPAECTATIDVRKIPGMTDETVVADVRRHLEQHVPHGNYEISILNSGEAAETSPDEEVVRIAADAFERRYGRRPETRGMVAATDGWWFANRAKIPTIMAFGPGEIAGCHVVDESVSIDELQDFAAIYEDVIRTFLGGSTQ